MEEQNHYKILGLSQRASKSEIKKAYRRLAKIYHPDKNKAEEAKAKFTQITKAYQTLNDDFKRRAYDLSQRVSSRPPQDVAQTQNTNDRPVQRRAERAIRVNEHRSAWIHWLFVVAIYMLLMWLIGSIII